MKKFLLTTEYSEVELQTLIEKAVQNVFQQELSKKFQPFDAVSDNMEDKLLTRKELMKYLNVSYPTIIKRTRDGVFSGKLIGGVYRYKLSEVSKSLDLINKRRRI